MTSERKEGRPRLVLILMMVLGLGVLSIPFFLTPPAYLDFTVRDAVFASDLSGQQLVITDDTTGKRVTAEIQKVSGDFIARIGRINSGRNAFTARMEGYKPSTSHVDAAALQNVRVPVDLTPTFGRLELTPVDATQRDEAVDAMVREGNRALTRVPQRVIAINLPPGRHRLAAQASGFCGTEREFEVQEGKVTKAPFPLSPDLKGDEIARFVLGWDNEPRDLDSHFRKLGVIQLLNPTHVFFKQKDGSLNGVPFARLDVDWQVPGRYETVTVRDTAAGEFEYLIDRYAGEGTISDANATVQLYLRGCEVRTFRPPAGCSERVWAVGNLRNVNGRVDWLDRGTCDEAEAWRLGVKTAVE